MLELLLEAGTPQSIAELASSLDVHRSIAYRIVRTLEDFRLVTRTERGVELGPGVAELARGVARDLRGASLHELSAIANELSMTAYVAILDGLDCITLMSIEPINEHATIAYKPGARHPITAGADGMAIQFQLDDDQLSRLEQEAARQQKVREARQRGYASSHGEVVPGISAVAVPLDVAGHGPAALAVVYVQSDWSQERIGERLMLAAAAIKARMRP
ncbi:helix-turn-helix domain-containing protein [Micromonospora sp. CPCC 205371]|nr:helix-turn-helix domain-containing protein [Micromonospora sp. CPCC 205371]